MNPICDAIRKRCLLEFVYDGRLRLVQPYCHGVTRKGLETLRAIQVGGESGGLGFGKLWTVSKMENLRESTMSFVPADPNYNRDDTALVEIHCRV